MQAVRLTANAGRALPLAVAAVLLAAGTSHAYDDTKKPPAKQQGGDHDRTIDASAAGYRLTYSSGGPSTTNKPLRSSDVTWTPPPCWFGPKYTAEQFKAEYTTNFNKELPDVTGTFRTAMGMDRDHYANGLDYPDEKGYKDFNVADNDKGQWWAVSVNPNADPVAQMSCNDERPQWVLNGQRPRGGTQHVISAEMLSRLAYAATQVPGVTVQVNPRGVQTVNIATWTWLKQKYTTVSVRASVDLGGGQEIWAETTARPASVHITPGTPYAKLFPRSGDCPIGAGGQVGAPYDGDAKADPPCGVTYLAPTTNRPPFQLDVTAKWDVSWSGSDGTRDRPLPEGVIDDPRDVTVQEYQSVNR
ncbi:hypothetical protein V2S66_14530 [Streptomyces sp. V4-01]|uniref:Secreted protein n=1 Tax=Actinacidiphila polyblastidii TaxID=3110430 RepID=A0ABU7PBI6_9ACTN|nr:hypothetical protein [Streptomyces sp. V4-01]